MAAMTAMPTDVSQLEPEDGWLVIASTEPRVDHLPANRLIAVGIGGSRVAVGVSFLSSPVTFLRLIGLDTASATRVTWLARTAGVRDVVLGVGTIVAAVTGRDDTSWLLAGAACDAVDAVVTGAAAREGRISRIRGALVAAGAVASVVAGVAALAAGRSSPEPD
jgi:hypothetical protein